MSNAPMPLIRLRDVRKIYPMGGEPVRALDGVDLEIQEGELLAIIGPSGSGKSTLMHILGFLDRPTSGDAWFDGRPVSRLGEAARARLRCEKIGFVFQAYNLLPRLNVLYNVLLPMSYHRKPPADLLDRAHRALEQVGMVDRALHRPSQLSGGQQQRVAIARSLINEPRLLLADEPTGNLDSHTAESILELLFDLHRQGRTIVMVTHDDNVAAHAQRTIRVLDGRIVEETAKC